MIRHELRVSLGLEERYAVFLEQQRDLGSTARSAIWHGEWVSGLAVVVSANVLHIRLVVVALGASSPSLVNICMAEAHTGMPDYVDVAPAPSSQVLRHVEARYCDALLLVVERIVARADERILSRECPKSSFEPTIIIAVSVFENY